MRIAQSTFLIGGHHFVVPELDPVALHEIREIGRNFDRKLPRAIAVAKVAAMLRFTYPWVTPAWLDEHLLADALCGLIENLRAQIALAAAAHRAAATVTGATSSWPN